MLQVYMFHFKDLLIDIREYLLDGMAQNFIYKVTKGTVGWSLMIHKIQKAKIYFALIL